jgi:hypothetical protein
VLLAGSFETSIDFGGGVLMSAGQEDGFVAKLTSAGVHAWSKRFGGSGLDSAAGIAVDAMGNVVIVGDFEGTINVGTTMLTSAGMSDVVVAQFNSLGNVVWSKRFGDSADQQASAVAVDSPGNVVVAGAFNGSIDFGGGAIQSAGAQDIFVAKLSPSGSHAWSFGAGDSAIQSFAAVGVDGLGNVLLAFALQGTVDFGFGPMTSAGATDMVIAKLGP